MAATVGEANFNLSKTFCDKFDNWYRAVKGTSQAIPKGIVEAAEKGFEYASLAHAENPKYGKYKKHRAHACFKFLIAQEQTAKLAATADDALEIYKKTYQTAINSVVWAREIEDQKLLDLVSDQLAYRRINMSRISAERCEDSKSKVRSVLKKEEQLELIKNAQVDIKNAIYYMQDYCDDEYRVSLCPNPEAELAILEKKKKEIEQLTKDPADEEHSKNNEEKNGGDKNSTNSNAPINSVFPKSFADIIQAKAPSPGVMSKPQKLMKVLSSKWKHAPQTEQSELKSTSPVLAPLNLDDGSDERSSLSNVGSKK